MNILERLVYFVILLIVAGAFYWILDWGIKKADLPEPFKKVAEIAMIIVVIVVACAAVLYLATGKMLFVS